MSGDYIRRIDCPGHEFGLEPCEEKLTRRGWSHPGGFFSIPDGDEQEDWNYSCDCEEQLKAREGFNIMDFYDRVNNLFDHAEAEDDYPDSEYDD